jgi:hypothetical protein
MVSLATNDSGEGATGFAWAMAAEVIIRVKIDRNVFLICCFRFI